MLNAPRPAASLNLGQVGWKYYNTIRKKAMEQEFSWSGLFTGLSIAFFIVAAGASALRFIKYSLEENLDDKRPAEQKIYYLENSVQAASPPASDKIYFI